ncbi:uncharacterized protein LOC135844530 [Planococcus citri]|uniref:uncharacterized protein LOC135844530 n=1 Tax=Planococcus citri TaxID=170843 RepID=UPI0031F9EDBA
MATLTAEQVAALLQSVAEQSRNIAALVANLSVASSKDTSPQVQLIRYDDSVETFSDFVERFEHYCTAQKLSDVAKVPTFISLLQPHVYRLLKYLCFPAKVDSKSYKDLTELLINHLCPKQLEIPARHTFLNRKQGENESIMQYVSELRKLSLPCGYSEDMLNIMLRDVFVSGLRSPEMLKRLFSEKDLTFKSAQEITAGMEVSAKNTAEMTNGSRKEASVPVNAPDSMLKKLNKFKKSSSQRSNDKRKDDKSKSEDGIVCFKCAKPGHRSPACTAKNLSCSFCKSDQHVAEACRKKKRHEKNKAKKLKLFREASPNDSCDDNESSVFNLYVIRESKQSESPIFVSVNVNGSSVKFEYNMIPARLKLLSLVHVLRV